jgi:ribosome recycling factor
VSIDYYGSPTPLKSLANINTPDSSTISIQPFDKSSLGAIEKAISLSDIGLTPSNDGIAIRLNIPPLTTERRKELVKQAAKYSEEGKVSVRNIRRDGIDEVKKQEKSSEISEDESKNLQEKIQKLTDKYVANIEKVLADKQKDIMTV